MAQSGASVTYNVSHWPADSRGALRWLMDDAGLDVEWAAATFSVPEARRADVDALVDYLCSPAARSAPAPHADAASVAVGAPGPALYQAGTVTTPAGWYPDPKREALWRWWDGAQWTAHVGPEVPELDRGWFPRRGDRSQSARGGGLAIAGFVGGQVLSVAVVLVAIALGATSRSVVTIFIGELALWCGLFGACKLAVRKYGTGSLRDLGLMRLQWGDVGIGSLAALVARVATLIIAAIIVLLFSFDDLTRDTSVTNQSGVSALGAIVLIVDRGLRRAVLRGAVLPRSGAGGADSALRRPDRDPHPGRGVRAGALPDRDDARSGHLDVLDDHAGRLPARMSPLALQRLGPGMVAHAVFNAIAVAIVLATL